MTYFTVDVIYDDFYGSNICQKKLDYHFPSLLADMFLKDSFFMSEYQYDEFLTKIQRSYEVEKYVECPLRRSASRSGHQLLGLLQVQLLFLPDGRIIKISFFTIRFIGQNTESAGGCWSLWDHLCE